MHSCMVNFHQRFAVVQEREDKLFMLRPKRHKKSVSVAACLALSE